MKKLVLSGKHRRRLEQQLRQTHDVRLYRRTLAVLEYDRGQAIAEIARALRVNRRSVHRWIRAYSRSLDPESLGDDDRPGRPRHWTEECSEWLQAFLRHAPTELGYYAVNWTVPLLQNPLAMSTAHSFSDHTIRRALRGLGYVWKRARYVLAPDPEREKKTRHLPAIAGLAAAQCEAGGGRNRPAAVPAAACGMGTARGGSSGANHGWQRQACAVRGD